MKRPRKSFSVVLAVSALLLLAAAIFWTHPVGVFDEFTEMRLYISGAQSHVTTVSGYRIHYYALGPQTGPVVVLVHGLGGRSEDWENLAPYLVKAGYRVYLPDLVGYGHSEKPQKLFVFSA